MSIKKIQICREDVRSFLSRRSEKHSSLENLILNLIQIKPCIPNRLAEGTYLVGRRKTVSPNHIHIVMVVNTDFSVMPGTFKMV